MIQRRSVLMGAAALAAGPRIAWADSALAPQELIERAKARALRPHRPVSGDLAPPFDRLDYDSYRGVHPIAGKAASLPLGPKFRADLLPPGWLYSDPVRISLPGHGTDFAPDLFHYDPALIDLPAPLPDTGDMGFSGLRLIHEQTPPDHWPEVLVVQGASYFRALAQDTAYGLSARALALGTGGERPEEFPVTEEIHVFDADDSVHFGCLIDSPRASAALIARLTPGRRTRMTCSLHLFAREALADAGIAPLTSMFQHSALGPARIDDFRPAVHDSAVLVIDNGAGERLWRPLANPARVQMSTFMDDAPRGFGLLQMPTNFEGFLDAEAMYHRRPSAWVRPRGDWGPGAVRLLEIPTENEFADNIVAFWRPDAPLAPGAHQFEYDLDWLQPGMAALPPSGHPLHPARMASGVEPVTRAARLFVLDFAGNVPQGAGPIQPDISATPGVLIKGVALYPLAEGDPVWRLSFLLTPEGSTDTAELRLRLRGEDGSDMAAVWLYRWTRSAEGGV